MLPELEKLREQRSKQYAQDKMSTALKGSVLWALIAVLSWVWLLVVAMGAEKSVEFWWGLIVIPLSVVLFLHFYNEWGYWGTTID
jgi:hypothetical protein